jgi:hypothetical protein
MKYINEGYMIDVLRLGTTTNLNRAQIIKRFEMYLNNYLI